MGRITQVLQLQWQAYWRRFVRPGNLTTSNEGLLLIIFLLALIRYFQALNAASIELSHARHATLEKLLMVVFLVWMFPLLSSAQLSISTKSLRQFPLTLKELFVIKVSSLLMPVFSWIVLGISLALIFPLLKAPAPFVGIIAVFLFSVSSFFLGITLAHLLTIPFWRRAILLITTVTSMILTTYVVRSPDTVSTIRALSFLPVRLVAGVAVGANSWGAILSLLVAAATLIGIAFWSFRSSREAVETSSGKNISSLILFPGKTGPLSHKDVRYFRKLLEFYLGLLTSATGCLYLMIGEVPGPEVFWIFTILVFFFNSTVAFNSFGLDYGPGLDRYSIFPLTGREVLLSKNLAFLTLVATELAPMFLLALWKLGLVPVLFGVIEVALLALGYLTCGNVFSVTNRFRLEFYRLSSGGPPFDALVGTILAILPAGLAVKFFGGPLWWTTILLLIIWLGFYSLSLFWAARRIERLILSGRHSVTEIR